MSNRIFCVVIVALMGFVQPTSAQTKAQATQISNRELVNSLFASMNPDIPQNAYLPEMVKDKLRWIIRENQAKPQRLLLSPSDHWTSGGKDVIASMNNDPGKIPNIFFSAEEIASRATFLPNESLKDMFLLVLTHEAIHLEVVLPSKDYKYLLAEEIRTWHKWIVGAIRPLRLQGRPILGDWALAEEILQNCGDNDCLAFREIVKQHTQEIQQE